MKKRTFESESLETVKRGCASHRPDLALSRAVLESSSSVERRSRLKTEAEKMRQKLVVEGGMDLVLPMTHQGISLDRECMEY
jgi:hypothetical protein